ncbi:phosphoglucomutase/phosphomannomutase family protein [Halomicrobium sp. IBSBa]|uniref:phosphoglucomutase/phosphomannomutase family protein n=1 Tax=Halomicrobium sp. IBSBa TaxID=2778916 RepID=UPI001ABFBA30|nr:phosphoglucomutase/phosphomannomutase family protein [Halomicrobium sp. IBSBa]MBO4247950.1 phosphoglucomutase/phosphomannomutase family protein [Halomicrobium sp. IBSBa]
MTDADAEAIAFGTDGWRATLDEFTDERVRMVGQGVATHLREAGHDGETVAVGYDARSHSRGFAEELARVLCANGFDVVLPDRDTPTPVVAWTVKSRGLAGALMVTASHNPPEYNGVKFVPAGGQPALADATDAVEAALARPDSLPESEWGSVEETDLLAAYLDHAVEFAGESRDEPVDLDGLTVAYDAMHGSGRGVTDRLLERAGADLVRLRCERDADFGGGAPEPVAERVEALIERVRDGDADLGIVNDGDADRIGVVTPDRGFLDPNLFFAAVYDDLLATRGSERPDGAGSAGVVRTVSTSSIVDRVAAAHGESVHETAVGFKHVAAAMAEHDALMGGEESGGFGLTAHLRNKDGVLLSLLAAAAAHDRPLDERVDALLAEHGEIHQGRISVDCPDDRKERVLAALESSLPDSVAGQSVDSVSTVDGFKMTLADGTWLLVRPSGTEPKLRVYAEATSRERVDELLAAGREIVTPLVASAE